MRSTLSALAVCSLVILPAGLAMAQEKIAPTRTYGNDRNYGKDFGTTYSNKSRLPPDRDFGLPAAARPKAMPEQQDGLVKGAVEPTHPITNDAATPTPPQRNSTGANGDAFGLPQLAPNHDLVPPAAASTSSDFFAHTTDFAAPRTDEDADTSETPLYTTRNPAAVAGTAQLEGDSAAPGTSGTNAFGSDAFGTKQTRQNN